MSTEFHFPCRLSLICILPLSTLKARVLIYAWFLAPSEVNELIPIIAGMSTLFDLILREIWRFCVCEMGE